MNSSRLVDFFPGQSRPFLPAILNSEIESVKQSANPIAIGALFSQTSLMIPRAPTNIRTRKADDSAFKS